MHILDMSETKKVGEFAEGFKRKYKALNVLVSYLFSYMKQYGMAYTDYDFCLCINISRTKYCLVLYSVQINNAGSIMSQRDVNAEGLEKSFATNVLGESKVKWSGREV